MMRPDTSPPSAPPAAIAHQMIPETVPRIETSNRCANQAFHAATTAPIAMM